MFICIYIYIYSSYVCVHVCMYVCMYVCLSLSLSVSLSLYIYIYMYIYTPNDMCNIYIYIYIYIGMYELTILLTIHTDNNTTILYTHDVYCTPTSSTQQYAREPGALAAEFCMQGVSTSANGVSFSTKALRKCACLCLIVVFLRKRFASAILQECVAVNKDN